MKARELRIGNYVFNDGVVNEVTVVGAEFVSLKTPQGNSIHAQYTLINPIPLTEEWLLKFGFAKNKENWFWKNWGTNAVEIIVWMEPYKKYGFQLGKGKTKVLDHVHQLQNLYFALTGTELQEK